MSLVSAVRDNAVKWLVGAIGTAAIGGLGWVTTNLVTKGDLADFAIMIGGEVRAELEPLAEQQRINTRAICDGRRATLKAALRDLKVEMAQMLQEEGGVGWDTRDAQLLSEWQADYEDASEELGRLRCE